MSVLEAKPLIAIFRLYIIYNTAPSLANTADSPSNNEVFE